MRNYLSFGGGVNSVAMMLMLLDQGIEFEAVFVDHGADYPETYHYLAGFQWWLRKNGYRPITILRPDVQGFDNLYDHCWHYRMVPSFMNRWCTSKFKIRVILKYIQTPCFQFIGIDYDEIRRAKISTSKGVENRYPLIEAEITREGCKRIILEHGLPVPMKSGCYFCPFQKVGQWRELRRNHPELFCKAEKLEDRNIEYRKERGKKPLFLNQYPKARLNSIVQENQRFLFEGDEYPPCQCGL